MSARVLLIEDDEAFRGEVTRVLTTAGHAVLERDSAEHALREFDPYAQDVVVTDVRMRSMNGLHLCELLKSKHPLLPCIVMTGFGTVELAVATLKLGAFDFLTKPFASEQLLASVTRALHHRSILSALHRMELDASEVAVEGELWGQSQVVAELREMVRKVAASEASVLISGESGTGKEVVARSIHQQSSRCQGPFVAINCAAIPDALLESELFGHTKGAFTDAKTERRGLLRDASGGTLFLDEVGEMPLSMQAKLLRALESRTVRSVGSHEEKSFDVRLLCATHRDLDQSVAEGRFREDLLYRIQVVQLSVPPLRHRGQDVLLLAGRFLERKNRQVLRGFQMSAGFASKLVEYPWPGNVRELQNAIERATALSPGDLLEERDLPPKIREFKLEKACFRIDEPTDLVTLEEMERRYILQVLESVGQSRAAATRVLGIDRSTLYRKMERFGIK